MRTTKKLEKLANKFNIHGVSNTELLFSIVAKHELDISSQTCEDGRHVVLSNQRGTKYIGIGKTLITALLAAVMDFNGRAFGHEGKER